MRGEKEKQGKCARIKKMEETQLCSVAVFCYSIGTVDGIPSEDFPSVAKHRGVLRTSPPRFNLEIFRLVGAFRKNREAEALVFSCWRHTPDKDGGHALHVDSVGMGGRKFCLIFPDLYAARLQRGSRVQILETKIRLIYRTESQMII